MVQKARDSYIPRRERLPTKFDLPMYYQRPDLTTPPPMQYLSSFTIPSSSTYMMPEYAEARSILGLDRHPEERLKGELHGIVKGAFKDVKKE